jgi:ABC-2 type transport system permease protein
MSHDDPVRPSTFFDALASELVKLRSLRSTPLMLLAGAVIIAGIAALGSRLSSVELLIGPGAISRVAFEGVLFGQIALAAVAVLAFTGEHETGGIRTTLAAVPKRGRLAATAVAVGLLSLAFGALVSLTAILVTYSGAVGRTSSVEAVTWDTMIRPTLGNALYLAAFGVLAFAAGLLLRNTAGTLTALIGATIILPITFSAMGKVGAFLGKWWPTTAGQQITRVYEPGRGALPPYAGFAVMCAAVVVVLAIAAASFTRNDP